MINYLIFILIWVCGCYISTLFPYDISRPWIMLWEYLIGSIGVLFIELE